MGDLPYRMSLRDCQRTFKCFCGTPQDGRFRGVPAPKPQHRLAGEPSNSYRNSEGNSPGIATKLNCARLLIRPAPWRHGLFSEDCPKIHLRNGPLGSFSFEFGIGPFPAPSNRAWEECPLPIATGVPNGQKICIHAPLRRRAHLGMHPKEVFSGRFSVLQFFAGLPTMLLRPIE